jgi:stage II sporulation protein D
VISDGKTMQVVNAVQLEDYVEGVVGNEMSPGWPRAALEAQAVASRSVGLASVVAAKGAGTFDVYADSRTQVYGGVASESPRVAKAVAATHGQVVLYDGKPAMTYYSASTGGVTMAGVDATGKPIPYLASVADPYDTLSPEHDWGPVLVGARAAAKALGLESPLTGFELDPATGHVTTAVAAGSGDDRMTLTGLRLQTDLGLPSTWFQVGLLALAPQPKTVAPGTAVTLTGAIEGLPGASLEARVPGGVWSIVAAIAPDSTGAFSVQVSPEATTQYRLAVASAAGALIKVRVSIT